VRAAAHFDNISLLLCVSYTNNIIPPAKIPPSAEQKPAARPAAATMREQRELENPRDAPVFMARALIIFASPRSNLRLFVNFFLHCPPTALLRIRV
jgi:hypothetical protein